MQIATIAMYCVRGEIKKIKDNDLSLQLCVHAYHISTNFEEGEQLVFEIKGIGFLM